MVKQQLDGKKHLLELMSSTSLESLVKNYLEEYPSSSSSSKKVSIYLLLLEWNSSIFSKLRKLGCKLVELFAEHRAMTTEEISRRLKCTRKWARELCYKFMVAGVLMCSSRSKLHIYHVKNAAPGDLDRAEMVYRKLKDSLKPRKAKMKKNESKHIVENKLYRCLKCKGRPWFAVNYPTRCIYCKGRAIVELPKKEDD